LYQKDLGNGMELCVYPRMYNSTLVIGPVGDHCYITQWCYESPAQAITAAEEWQDADKFPKSEPDGWFRHAESGRRRPNGDPEKEYIAL
jgi:hypothetical protein